MPNGGTTDDNTGYEYFYHILIDTPYFTIHVSPGRRAVQVLGEEGSIGVAEHGMDAFIREGFRLERICES